MPVITIPLDYDEKLHASVVPICINDTDIRGNLIDRNWFELGVIPVADNLRRVAKRVLSDVWRVSEITECAVHGAWRFRGSDLGSEPGIEVYKRAKWYAEDLRQGGRRARSGSDVELFSETLNCLKDQFDLASDAENRETLDKLVAQAKELGMAEAVAMVPMMLRGCGADEYKQRFGKRRNTLTQMFFRNMRKAAEAGTISW